MFLSKFILVFLPHLSQKKQVFGRTTLRIFFRFIERVIHRDIYICEQVFFFNSLLLLLMFFSEWFFFFSSEIKSWFGVWYKPRKIFQNLNLSFPERWNIVCGFWVCISKCFKKNFISRKKCLIFVLGMAAANLNKNFWFSFFSLRNRTFPISQI